MYLKWRHFRVVWLRLLQILDRWLFAEAVASVFLVSLEGVDVASAARSDVSRSRLRLAALWVGLGVMALGGCAVDASAPDLAFCSGGGARGARTCSTAVDPDPVGTVKPPSGPRQTAPARADVASTLASASAEIVDDFPKPALPPPHVARLTLEDAVAAAVLSHPTMGAAAARVVKASAGVDAAQTAFRPTLSVMTGTGWAMLGQYNNYPHMFSAPGLPGSERTDLGLSFRQLIWDFGAAQEEVERSKAVVDSEKLKLADQAEDIALRTVNAYFNLLEQQELLNLIDATVENEHKLAALVQLSQQNGNSAVADVDRINSKIIEIEATRADIDASYRVAIDEFHRLTGLEPKQVLRPALATKLLPKTSEAAVAEARTTSPAVLAIRAEGVALEHQLAEQKASAKPRIDFEADATVKHYLGVTSTDIGTVDNRAMVVLSYKLFDGGMQDTQLAQIRASQNENRFNELDQIETLELNIRRFYETIAADRAKSAAAERGVATAEKVNASYLEQFKDGKRTVFEVLDSYTSIFSMHKNRIDGQYEAYRAEYGILRNLGRLNLAFAGKPTG